MLSRPNKQKNGFEKLNGRPYAYQIYGVNLLSEIKLELPEPPESADLTAPILLTIGGAQDFEGAPRDLELRPDEWYCHAVLDDGALYMRWENWFDFLISRDGGQVVCRNLSGYALESFEAYLTNFAISAALIQKGEETLHATVVDLEEGAVGLLGASGAGKSSLASFLAAKGGDVVTDDMLRITIEGEKALAHPGPHRLKLFNEPAKRFLHSAHSRGSWSPGVDKLIYELGDPKRIRPPRRLTALYHLCAPDKPEDNQVRLDRLLGLDLFKTICASTMNSRLHASARLERQFRFAQRIAQLLPVYRLTYPRTFEAFDEVAARINGSAQA